MKNERRKKNKNKKYKTKSMKLYKISIVFIPYLNKTKLT
jgi:hypothetical protein